MEKNPPSVFVFVSGMPYAPAHLSSAAASERDRPAVDHLFAPDDPELVKQIDRRVAVGNDQLDPVAGFQNSFCGIFEMAVFITEIPAVGESI